jgi:hypothetical protein
MTPWITVLPVMVPTLEEEPRRYPVMNAMDKNGKKTFGEPNITFIGLAVSLFMKRCIKSFNYYFYPVPETKY